MEFIRSPQLWTQFLENNGYHLDKCVGEGSFGDVFAATCIVTGQAWAVKRLVARRDIREDINAMGEIAALASIGHRGVVRLHEVLLSARMACIVMELAPAGNLEMLLLQGYGVNNADDRSNLNLPAFFKRTARTLEENNSNTFNTTSQCILEADRQTFPRSKYKTVLEPEKEKPMQTLHSKTSTPLSSRDVQGNITSTPLSLEPVCLSTAFTQVASALCYCHSIGLAHRDINPSNVLVFNPRLFKLADFGLCFRCHERNKSNDASEDSTSLKCSDYLGHSHYLAPEVRRHEPFYAIPADVWSLGCLLYFMLLSQHPSLDYALFADVSIADACTLVPEDFQEPLRNKCLQTLTETLKTEMKTRISVKEVFALWDHKRG